MAKPTRPVDRELAERVNKLRDADGSLNEEAMKLILEEQVKKSGIAERAAKEAASRILRRQDATTARDSGSGEGSPGGGGFRADAEAKDGEGGGRPPRHTSAAQAARPAGFAPARDGAKK
jgi:hypothetical protein